MPMMVMQRSYTVRSTKGYTIRFEKGVPTYVVDQMVSECMTFGAMPAKGEVLPVEEEAIVTAAPEGLVREKAIAGAVKTLVARNGREDFGANGRPKVAAIEKIVGFDVDQRERDSAWDKYQAEENAKLDA